jgi:hypothetical protein
MIFTACRKDAIGFKYGFIYLKIHKIQAHILANCGKPICFKKQGADTVVAKCPVFCNSMVFGSSLLYFALTIEELCIINPNLKNMP